MINFKIPVQNNVEIIPTSISIEFTIHTRPQFQPTTMEGRIVLNSFETQLNILAAKFAVEISQRIQAELEAGNIE